jgi:hypothetical protein
LQDSELNSKEKWKNMFESLIIGIGGIVLMMILWVVIQGWWRRTFADYVSDEDVLAGRSRCGDCGCSAICEDRARLLSAQRPVPEQETTIE